MREYGGQGNGEEVFACSYGVGNSPEVTVRMGVVPVLDANDDATVIAGKSPCSVVNVIMCDTPLSSQAVDPEAPPTETVMSSIDVSARRASPIAEVLAPCAMAAVVFPRNVMVNVPVHVVLQMQLSTWISSAWPVVSGSSPYGQENTLQSYPV